MEEHVALDSKKQKKFVKSLKGIKKLMKETGALPEKSQKQALKGEKIKKRRLPRRGLVYLSHIPHGFYEHQMTEYFKQFGVVTNARVIRSRRTGRSKGCAFVEFRDMTVAQVVADTMNNYLMGKRLIKAVYIPPKDQRLNVKRKNWNPQNNPGRRTKLNMKKAYKSHKTEAEDMRIARKLFNNLTNNKNKLKELGIDYDFFTPVDVPEGLMEQIKVKKEKDEDMKNDVDEKPKKKKKDKKTLKDETTDDKTVDTKQEKTISKEKKQKQNKIESNVKKATVDNKNKKQINGTDKTKESTKNKKDKKENIEINKSENDKKQKLQKAGIKPLEDYISIVDEEDNDSDSSYHFDSDEYDNELNADDGDASSDEDDESNEDEEDSVYDEDNEESNGDDDSDSEEIPVQKKNMKGKKMEVPRESSKPKEKQVPFMQLMKRKVTEKTSVPSKKPKFEKQNNKKLPSKQLKKKK